MAPNSTERIFFLHIPKTAGQTLATRLATAFPPEQSDILGPDLVSPDGFDELQRLFQTKRFVERHVNGPVLACARDISILTTIRNPVDQIISTYLHISRTPGHSLYPVVHALPPQEFFSRYGDFFRDRQTSYLVGSFFPPVPSIWPQRYLAERLYDAVDRLRWFVPSESVDEYVGYWSLETGRQVVSSHISINAAIRRDDYLRLSEIVQRLPHLFGLDAHLHSICIASYEKYKGNVIVNQNRARYGERAYGAEVFSSNAGKVWLSFGWYPPELRSNADAIWWAGPSQNCGLRISSGERAEYLSFSVVVFCGLTTDSFFFWSVERQCELVPSIRQRSVDVIDFIIPVAGLLEGSEVIIRVAEVWSPMMVDKANPDFARRSFAATEWRLVEKDA